MEVQRALLSAALRLMIGLAVPERRKSASLTELINESLTTAGDGLIRFSFGSVVDEGKWTVNWNECVFCGETVADLVSLWLTS